MMATDLPPEILSEHIKSTNIAERLDAKDLNRIGEDCINRYDEDEGDREEWLETNKKGLQLASQVSKGAMHAGEKTFDVMYPLITTASIQFASRAYPNIIKGRDVVKSLTPGLKNDKKTERATRVVSMLNYQILNLIEDWPEEMDQMLHILPVTGCHFKKTYQSFNTTVSENVSAEDLVIPFKAKSLRSAPRISQKLMLSQNDVIERQRRDMYRDMKIDYLGFDDEKKDEQLFIEQHCFLDLDEDGYKEPYVVVIHHESGEVMRITARFNLNGISVNDRKEIFNIRPVNHYTRYLFMPAFDGNVYGFGFGSLLGPINLSTNAIINQLLDAGALHSRQGGFVGSDLHLGRNQSMYFKIGEWKQVRFRGDDIRKNLLPIPTKEPSSVLFQLLGTLITAGKEMASVSELLSGEQRQSNVPASTTLALIEQGLKVFSGIYGRVWRSLKREVEKIRDLNHLYLDDEMYQRILDVEGFSAKDDFDPSDHDVVPVVNPTEITEIQRLMKAEALLAQRGTGLNDEEINKRYLDALEVDHPQDLIVTDPEPDPKMVAEVELLQAQKLHEDAEADLAREKRNSEVVEQMVSRAGVKLDEEKLKIERARAAKEITAKPEETEKPKKEAQRKLDKITPTSKKRDQKQPYREVGMKSNNTRRSENKKSA